MTIHNARHDDMATRIERAKKEVKDKGSAAIQGLEYVAHDLAMTSIAGQLQLVNRSFQADTFKLIVVGRQKNGKSTLVNATLGKVNGKVPAWCQDQGPMPTDELPATAILTRVVYAPSPFVRAWHFEGTKEDWPLDRYQREAILRGTEARNRLAFEKIREFEVGYPAQLLESGVTYIDSPGTDEHPSRTAITTAALADCDAAIVVYRHSPSPGEAEMAWVAANILEAGVRVFTVVNLWDGRVVDDRLRELIWDKLVRELLDGPEYQGQDFTSKDIYFIDALRAQQTSVTHDGQGYEASGLALFEQRLTDFLLNERYETHMGRFVTAAEKHASTMVQQISQRRAALQADRKKLEDAFRMLEPKLEDIHQRRDKLTKILDRYRRECVRELTVSFEHMVGELRQDLLGECQQHSLQALQGVTGVIQAHFTKKKVSEEAANICTEVIKQRIDTWCKNPPSKPGAQQVLEPIVRRMVDEVADEVAAIQTEFQDIHFGLTGWRPAISSDPKSEVLGRIIGIVGGILLSDVGLIFGGGGGFRGIAGTLSGYVVGGIVTALMGLSFSVALPVVLVAGLLGGIAFTRAGLEGRIWKFTCAKANEALRDLPGDARPQIETEANKAFNQLTDALLQDVDAIIDQEQQNVQQVLELTRQEQAEKDKSLQALDQGDRQITERRKELQDVLVLVKQVR